MFEKTLSAKLKRIFDLSKVSFDLPSESQEQECLFIEVVSSKGHVKDKKFVSKVTGKIRVFCNTDKLPYGYFSKRIDSAETDDTKDLFFYDIEENNGTFRNIAERTLSFVYLFEAEYNPNLGLITELNNEITVGT